MSQPTVKRNLEAVRGLKLSNLCLYFCGQYKELENMITEISCNLLKIRSWGEGGVQDFLK